ncbi:MAG TPA: hypothetical protein VFW05_12395 [Verrucomicrobiae bacterium]|nr:hypothetical protein [Verrucomicrobiae bacterium]
MTKEFSHSLSLEPTRVSRLGLPGSRRLFDISSPRGSALIRSMKGVVAIAVCLLLAGCGPPPPVAKETHIAQVQGAVSKAGGVTNILNESRILFSRLSGETNFVLDRMDDSRWVVGLSGITNLGDVLHYEPSQPDRIRIRIHNSHFDTYFIALQNPDRPEPAGFEKIAGNVGFIEQDGAGNSHRAAQ